jgi:F0F1-type ATP synthase membrane subunit b/b'
MSERLRTLDSRISFFAFADIITAVSGMLIFITLLLATDLGRPTKNRPSNADRKIQEQLDDALRQQLDTDAQNRQLQELLAAAETAPALEKIEADIAHLRSQLSQEQQKQSAITEQMTKGEAALQARDAALGLTDLKATIQRTIQEAESIAHQEAKTRSQMEGLEQQVNAAQSRLLNLRERDGKIWLIPDKSSTTKEPILVTVTGRGATVETFDHPDQRKQWDKSSAQSSLKDYLRRANSLNQYVLFEVKPSGIQLFQSLLESTRAAGFEVGSDALEENVDVQGFSTPPPIDEPVPPKNAPVTVPVAHASPSNNSPTEPTRPPPATTSAKTNSPAPATPAAAPPQKLGWWQRFLRWVGL